MPTHTSRLTARALLLAGLALACGAGAAEPADPLAALNASFRSTYAAYRTGVMQAAGPVIIQSGDKMILIRHGQRTEAPALTARYHEYKSVAHVPLATYLMLIPGAGTKLDEGRQRQLRDYRTLVLTARESIGTRGFEPDQRDRQFRILDQSLALIGSALSNGIVSRIELDRFTQNLKDDILANAYDAAEDQITTMHRQFKAWQAEMTPEERQQLRVAVSSVHMARVGNIAMQYFSATLEEPYEGRFEQEETTQGHTRLMFTESVFDEQEILKAVATHIVDEGIGISFFNDGQRMHRDLLADATEEIIMKQFSRSPQPGTHQSGKP